MKKSTTNVIAITLLISIIATSVDAVMEELIGPGTWFLLCVILILIFSIWISFLNIATKSLDNNSKVKGFAILTLVFAFVLGVMMLS